VNSRLEKLFAAFAREVEQRLRDFRAQNVTNTSWAFATVNMYEGKLCSAFAAGSEVANTARAFATVNYHDEKIFAASGPLWTGTRLPPVARSGLVNTSEWVGTGRVRECMGG